MPDKSAGHIIRPVDTGQPVTQTFSRALQTVNKLCPSILTLVAAVLMPIFAASAQSSLNDDLIRKQDVSAADKQIIKAFIDGNAANLKGTPLEIKKAREALVKPVERDGVTVSFRVAMGSDLVTVLKPLVNEKEREVVVVNALRIAGEVATTNMIDVLLEGLKDPRESVRYAATHAMAQFFIAADKFAPAITKDDGARCVRGLVDVIEKENSVRVVDGASIALMSARPFMKGLAVQRLAEAGGRKAILLAKSTEPVDLGTHLRIAGALRTDLLDAQKITPDAVLASVKFAGQTLVLVKNQMKTSGDRVAIVQTAKACHGIISLGSEILKGPEIDQGMPKLLDQSKDADFEKAVMLLTGPGGLRYPGRTMRMPPQY